MSSSKSPITDQTIALQLKTHSKGNERRIKKWLMGINGVRRVDFNVNNGVVIVSGTIDPPTLIMMLENYGVKAEIFGHQHDSKEIVAQSKVINPLNDPNIAALLERLPGISAGMQTVEVIKTVKFVFRDEENGRRHYKKNTESLHGNKTLEITTTNLGGLEDKPCHGGDGHCAAFSSCCGGHNMHCFQHGYPHGIFPPAMGWPQPGYWGVFPLGAPPWLAVGAPSAPPLPEDDNYSSSPSLPPPLPPPPETNPPYTAFSDDNTSGSCTIM